MDLVDLDYLFVSLYFFTLLAFSIITRLKSTSFSDFSVANRSTSKALVFASLSATFIGPGYSIALADKGYSSGYLFLLVFSFFSIQTVFTALFLAPKLQQHKDCYSLGDVLNKAYGPQAKFICGITSVLLCVGFTAVMAKAGGLLISNLLSLTEVQGILLVTCIGLIFTFTGGLKAVIAAEAFQFIVILLAFAALIFYTSSNIDLKSFESISDIAINKTTEAYKDIGPLALTGLCITFFFGELLIPPYANRALAAKDEKSSKYGFLMTGLFSIVWFLIVISLGLLSYTVLQEGQNSGVLIQLSSAVLPAGLVGLFIAAIAAIVMSTQESVLNAGATAFVKDIAGGRYLEVKNKLLASRVMTFIIASCSILFALYVPSIISALLISYSVWAPTIAIPLAWYLLGLPTNNVTGITSMILGLTFALVSIGIDSANAESGLTVLVGIGGNIFGIIISPLLIKFFPTSHIEVKKA